MWETTFDFYTERVPWLSTLKLAFKVPIWKKKKRCQYVSAPARGSSEVDAWVSIHAHWGMCGTICVQWNHAPSFPPFLSLTAADVDECSENRCHPSATCSNTPGSFSCRCQPGYYGDGFQCTPGKVWEASPCNFVSLNSDLWSAGNSLKAALKSVGKISMTLVGRSCWFTLS